MLVLGRTNEDKVIIRVGGKEVAITVMDCRHGTVRLGFQADRDVTINRGEVQKRIDDGME